MSFGGANNKHIVSREVIRLSRIGGLSPLKQKKGSSAPERKGLWAFVYPHFDLFYCSSTDSFGQTTDTKRKSRAQQFSEGIETIRQFDYTGLIWTRIKPEDSQIKDATEGFWLVTTEDLNLIVEKYIHDLRIEWQRAGGPLMPHKEMKKNTKYICGATPMFWAPDQMEVFIPAHKGKIA